MSRAERRAYQRITKNQDPYAVPVRGAAKARLDQRQKQRRTSSRRPADPGRLLSRRAAWWVVGGVVVAFAGGLSLAWGNGNQATFATLVGAATGVGWLVLSLGFFWLRRRARINGGGAGSGGAARR